MKHFNAGSWLDELQKDSRARKDRGDKLEDVLRLKFDTITVQLQVLKEAKVVAYLDGDETLEGELKDAITKVDEERERCESVLLAMLENSPRSTQIEAQTQDSATPSAPPITPATRRQSYMPFPIVTPMREQESSKSKDGDSQDESGSETSSMSHVKDNKRDVHNVRITRGSDAA